MLRIQIIFLFLSVFFFSEVLCRIPWFKFNWIWWKFHTPIRHIFTLTMCWFCCDWLKSFVMINYDYHFEFVFLWWNQMYNPNRKWAEPKKKTSHATKLKTFYHHACWKRQKEEINIYDFCTSAMAHYKNVFTQNPSFNLIDSLLNYGLWLCVNSICDGILGVSSLVFVLISYQVCMVCIWSIYFIKHINYHVAQISTCFIFTSIKKKFMSARTHAHNYNHHNVKLVHEEKPTNPNVWQTSRQTYTHTH